MSAALLALTTPPLQAAELVTNGGFETGDTSGFSDSSGFAFIGTGSSAHSGSFGYVNGTSGSDGVLSQALATLAGQSYSYSFWLQNDEGTPNDFTASLGGIVLLALTDAGPFGFTQFTGTVTPGADATLSFAFRNDNAFWSLDDVSVTGATGGGTGPVPEPADWALLLTGFAMVGTALRLKARSGYQPAR